MGSNIIRRGSYTVTDLDMENLIFLTSVVHIADVFQAECYALPVVERIESCSVGTIARTKWVVSHSILSSRVFCNNRSDAITQAVDTIIENLHDKKVVSTIDTDKVGKTFRLIDESTGAVVAFWGLAKELDGIDVVTVHSVNGSAQRYVLSYNEHSNMIDLYNEDRTQKETIEIHHHGDLDGLLTFNPTFHVYMYRKDLLYTGTTTNDWFYVFAARVV